MRSREMISKWVLNSLTVASLLSVLSVSAHADQQGGNSGGGGDALAMEFVGYAHAWDQLLSLIPENERMGIDPKKFHEAVSGTVVRTQDHVQFQGEVDAYNEPGRILLNRSRLTDQLKAKKFGLALHEYLGTMGLDRKYELSEPLLKKYLKAELPTTGGVCEAASDLNALQVAGKLVLDYAVKNSDVTGIQNYPLESSSVAFLQLRKNKEEALYLIQVDAFPLQSINATVRCDEASGGVLKLMGFAWHSQKGTGVMGGDDYGDINDVTLRDPRGNSASGAKLIPSTNSTEASLFTGSMNASPAK